MLIKISIIRASRRAGPPPLTPHTPEGPKHFSPSRNLPFPLWFSQSHPLPPLPVIQQNLFSEGRKWLQESSRQIIVKSCLSVRTLRAEGREKQRFSKLCSLYYPLSLPQHHSLRSFLSGCSLSAPIPQPTLPLSALLDGVQGDRALADP